ncbi:MAG: anaerobic ribonucleoside-triphosphate reductase [Candidatus Pseudobacter hemicellulosilyticus]|uniref:Anaerobic ribonucleoside-triphosphate reductase n=1 Tax=Candidatus Pseudobacter hemicellulosilyticus TaxID=3121375 RepID=A0AAJ5WM85_9BACT|nr:MAG: anaerobic ribonucleoside-triphosphate reductase [Pseudobacter sp.]
MNRKKEQPILLANNDKRTKCLIYTRVMGYHRPTESFNIGKKGEHKDRLHFSENACHGKSGL